MKKQKALSKSRILDGITCHKKLYLGVYQPDLKASVSQQKQSVFDQGKDVGLLAQKEYPGGFATSVEYWDIEAGINKTKKAIDDGHNTIYEAFFGDSDLNCRVDILYRKNQRSAWNLIEVKSGTSAKDEYVLDAAVQFYILKSIGVKIDKVILMHLNSKCIYPDLSNLFVEHDATKEVVQLTREFPEKIADLKKLIKRKTVPAIDIGRHCVEPYECDFKNHCWKHVPDYSVFDLPLAWRLFERGYLSLEDIDRKSLSKSQLRAFDVAISNKRFIEKQKIKAHLEQWKTPLFHLDFETLGPAVPMYDGTRPYDSVPFQFSLDIQETFGGRTEHFEYLHPDESDPREAIARNLTKWIPKSGGSVVAFNASFEAKVIEKLANQFPDLSKYLLSIRDRLVDPLPIVKAHVYDREFRGSFSIKYVAPALLGKKWSYESLDVSDGKLAQIAFSEMIDPATPKLRKKELRQQLLDYCAQDTQCMVELVNWLWSPE